MRGRTTTIVASLRMTLLGAVAAASTVPLAPWDAVASAAPCPDVEVVFARGTTEPPGVGGIGQAFVDSVRSSVSPRTVGVYAVNYPASTDFPTAADGIIDAGNHLRAMAATCPDTRLVLGGYSQGAAVMGYVTEAAIPPGFTPPAGISGPLPPDIARHVAAVALFGKPSSAFLDSIDAPPIVIGPLYADRTIDLCEPGDPICSDGDNGAAHGLYAINGMVGQAAGYVAGHL